MRVFELEVDGDSSQTQSYSPHPVEQEVTLQRWLQQNPNVLLEETILVIGREPHSGNGPIDLLAVDRYGNTVVFEMKIGDTKSESTSEDKIVGQPQRYAGAIESWDYETLNEVYHGYQDEIASGKWSVDDPVPVGEDLRETFNRVFGNTPDQFNHHQRMVIVAEKVTWSTAQTARYLQRGPGRQSNIQCVQVQRFKSPKDGSHSVLASNLVVDYDLSRVRPPTHTNPIYAEMNARIADRAFQSIADIVHAQDPADVFTAGFGEREPSLISNHPEHPESVRYTLRVKPDSQPGHVGITIDMDGDDSALEALRESAQEFEAHGYSFNQDNTRFRIVEQQWRPVEDVRELEHDGLLDEIAEQYATLIRTGHEILTTGP